MGVATNKTRKIHITKADNDKMQAFGWANVAIRVDGEVIQDWQDDIVEMAELENAAYNFVLHYRSGGEMHKKSDVATLIESVVFTKEKMDAMGIPPETIPEAWWIGFQVNDPDVWEKVKDGEYQMFSIEGDAVREQVEAVEKSKNYLTFKEQMGILYDENNNNGVTKGGPGSGRYPKGSGKQAYADGIKGVKTSKGQKIKGFTSHGAERQAERTVPINSIKNALTKPLDVLTTKRNGKEAHKYIGKWAQVIVGKDNPVIITTYKTSKKLREKLTNSTKGGKQQ